MKSLSLIYASSLFSLCDEENKTEDIITELKEINKIFLENEDYISLLDSPTIPLPERLSLIDKAFAEADEYLINFIKILCEKKCVCLFSDCAKQFEKLYNKKHNIENVTVITASPLSDALKERLIAKLKKDYGKEIILDAKVDKSILGGIVIRTENSQTDASVRARLDSIKAQLSSAY